MSAKKKTVNTKITFGKEALVNKLLFVLIFSIIACIVLKLIYIGYIHVNYVLGMPKFMMSLFVIFLILGFFFGFRYYKSEKEAFPTCLVFSAVFALSSLSIYFYNLYAIRALWGVIGAYMVLSFIYYIYLYYKNKK